MAGRRAPVRSSARLSNSGGAAGGSGSAASSGSGGRPASEARERAAAAAAAAARRARAAERAREVEDSPSELRAKCRRLARALQNAKHLVVYTGAGISTAADIPDYRGPDGVWTRLQRGEEVGRVEVARARPTFTHMALTALWARGTLKFVASQNCDGLHVRAGLPRRALAELHGDMFAERCARCRRVYLRAFDTTERTARHAHATRRLCHACGAELQDSVVHFGERGRAAWPLNWAGALRHAAAADVVLCLGSSLKVLRRYPRLWRMHAPPRARPDLYIVNLQWTPKDAVAKLKINARCDAVMAQVARRLRLRVPRYSPRRDPLLAHAEPLLPPEAHTTRRVPLRVPLHPATPPSVSTCPSDCPSDPPSDSPSGSDSDDEVPLRRLAERMRAEPTPPPADTPPPEPPSLASPLPPDPPPPPLHIPSVPAQPPPPHTPRAPPAPPWPVPRPPRPPLPLPPPDLARLALPDLLHAFQVNMKSGDATILLRAEHAPSVNGAVPRVSPPSLAPLSAATCLRAPSLLRRFRRARPPPAPAPAPAPAPVANGLATPAAVINGLVSHGAAAVANGFVSSTAAINGLVPPAHVNGLLHCASAVAMEDDREEKPNVNLDVKPKDGGDSEQKMDVDCDSKIKIKLEVNAKNGFDFESKPKLEFPSEAKSELQARTKTEESEELETDPARGWAAALIARAVLACRARLYPGLHCMLPAPPAAPPAACAWCARHCRAPRCLWYGPPALTPPARRAARRVRQRRYLCACCPASSAAASAPAPASAPASAPAAPDDSGWYGKGYRKGRRRPRARR